jgi:Na+/H+-dicarboxylate symporter
MCLSGRRIWPLLKHLREELLIVMGTASSDAVLPQIVRKLAVRMSSRGAHPPTPSEVAQIMSTKP